VLAGCARSTSKDRPADALPRRYHLGQVLYTGKDFVIMTWRRAGRASATAAETLAAARRAGMLRSSTSHRSRHCGKGTSGRGRSRLEPWGRFWLFW